MFLSSIGYASVKGCRHTHPTNVDIDADGLIGDRQLAFVDATDLSTLRTVAHPRLLTLSASRLGPSLTLTTPHGSVAQELGDGTAADVEYWDRRIPAELFPGPCSDVVSDFLGRALILARAAQGRFVYAEPVTFLLAGELHDAAKELGVTQLDPRRFRANLVIDDTAIPGSRQNDWVRRTFAVGEAVLSVVDRVKRCAVIDRDPDTGERDLPLFSSLGTSRGEDAHCFGYAATVLRPGLVRVGDPVRASSTILGVPPGAVDRRDHGLERGVDDAG